MASFYLFACLIFVCSSAFGAPIRVGFLIDYEADVSDSLNTEETTWPALKAQLENNTNTVTSGSPIQVIEFLSYNMTRDPTILLGQVDVMAISNGWEEVDENFDVTIFTTICQFVQGGGGIVFHGWAFETIGWIFTNETQASLVTKCAPIQQNTTDEDPYWYIETDSSMKINTSHPITSGLPALWNHSMMASAAFGAPRLAPGAVGLSVYLIGDKYGYPLNTSTIVYMNYGSGRSVFIGQGYSAGEADTDDLVNIRSGTAGDRLLRQAIVWAYGSGSHTSTTTSGNTDTSEAANVSFSSRVSFAFLAFALACM